MEELEKCLESGLNKDLIQIVLSAVKNQNAVQKVSIRPVLIQDNILYQASEYKENKVYHKNLDREESISYIKNQLADNFKQCQISLSDKTIAVLVSKKGKITIRTTKTSGELRQQSLEHNRNKKYILNEGTRVDFLVDLGVMTEDGKIVRTKYDKFKQINRFLEFIEDILPSLEKDRENTIIDFGCGKSYLTFAVYYYLKELKGYPVNIIGLDLKEDVIETCNNLRKRYGYDKLNFYKGDIASFEGVDQVDMVITLHACDTATDYALAKAVRWGAKVILSVPCCQHEINGQIQNELWKPILKYGLLKERISALITDGIRAELLESAGYRTQILEFIDMEHTPKNILIRAVKQGQPKSTDALERFMEDNNVNPSLRNLLYEKPVSK